MTKLSFAFITIIALAFTSCKKEYTCECTTKVTVGTLTNTSTSSSKIKANLAKATSQCNESDYAPTTSNGITTEKDCSIK